MHAYEIYSDKFSQIVNAWDMVNAINAFRRDHPGTEVIAAENVMHRDKQVMEITTIERKREREILMDFVKDINDYQNLRVGNTSLAVEVESYLSRKTLKV